MVSSRYQPGMSAGPAACWTISRVTYTATPKSWPRHCLSTSAIASSRARAAMSVAGNGMACLRAYGFACHLDVACWSAHCQSTWRPGCSIRRIGQPAIERLGLGERVQCPAPGVGAHAAEPSLTRPGADRSRLAAGQQGDRRGVGEDGELSSSLPRCGHWLTVHDASPPGHLMYPECCHSTATPFPPGRTNPSAPPLTSIRP